MPFTFSPRESLFWNARQVPSNYFLLHVTEQIPQRGHLKCVLFPQLLPAQSIGVLGLFSFLKGANLGHLLLILLLWLAQNLGVSKNTQSILGQESSLLPGLR